MMGKDKKRVMRERVIAEEVIEVLMAERNDEQREVLMRFFKTGKGQYGEGDQFLGLRVPQTRAIVKEAKGLVALEEISKLLASEWHEIRLAGLLLLVEDMKDNLPKKKDSAERLEEKAQRREEIARFYLDNARQANNWDLVDLSCQYIVGPLLRLDRDYDMETLLRLAESDNLWEQRIAVVTTLDFIRHGMFSPTLTLVEKLKGHPHDLMHKAMGWMLREIGKKDEAVLTDYLDQNCTTLPRTTLRYAIERLPAPTRRAYLSCR